MLNIGCHLSTTKGYENMGKEALKIGANTFQYFTRNPRGGKAKDINEKDILALRKLMEENNFAKILAHAPYTLNGCSADESTREFASEMMADDLERLKYLPTSLYNFHPGSHVKQGVDVGINYIVEMLNKVLKPEHTTIVLLETMAGKGTEVGRSFDELAYIFDNVVHNDKLRVCFDTCHVHDAGYDIVNDFAGVLESFDRLIGKKQIAAFHINDSKNVSGAKKDRHENIGFGEIGFDALKYIMYHPDFKKVPKILETPYVAVGGDSKDKVPPYKQEIEMFRKGEFDPQNLDRILGRL